VVLLPSWLLVLRSSIWQGPPVLFKGVVRFVVFLLMVLWAYAIVRLSQRMKQLRQRE
jgi:hypothetical protein